MNQQDERRRTKARASVGAGVWKSSQKWSVQRSAIRSIPWLDLYGAACALSSSIQRAAIGQILEICFLCADRLNAVTLQRNTRNAPLWIGMKICDQEHSIFDRPVALHLYFRCLD